MAYRPEPFAGSTGVAEYLSRELLRISTEFDVIAEGRFLEGRAVAPGKPREYMLAIADGVNWNPGAGKGLYEYKNGSWSKL